LGAIFLGALKVNRNRSKPLSDLRLVTVKVGLSQAEATELDARRGHYPRAVFLRAAGLGAELRGAPDPAQVTTWAESARVQACFTQVNRIAHELNTTAVAGGSEAAAAELLARSSEILAAFKKFRQEILGGPDDDEV